MRNTRPLGLAIAAIGAVAVIVGLIGWVSSGGEPEGTAAVTTTTQAGATTVPPATTTTVPTTTTAALTTTAAETTTTAPPTTTTTLGRDDISAFVDEFSAALDTGDQGFVEAHLHPQVIDGYGADLCTTWITNEIMTLSDYRLIEGPEGPFDQSFATPGGDRSIADAWSGRVAFTFQGEELEGDAGFAVLDGVVYWLGQCR